MGVGSARYQRWVAASGAASVLIAGLVLGAVPGTTGTASAATPVDNPPIANSCGIDVTLVLDASGSIQSSHAVEDVRDAADAFLEALRNTRSTARVTQFASLSEQLAPPTVIDDAALAPGGPLRTAINRYYNPIPPRPSAVNIYRYDGSGNPLSAPNYQLGNSYNQYTNWDQSLDQAGDVASELVVYVTDGDPTAFDFNKPGDPFDPGPPPDVAVGTDRSSEASALTLDRAVEEANVIKTASTRMLAVGVGSAVNNSQSQDRLKQIAGPKLVTDLSTVNSINDVDVAAVPDFEDLAQFLREVVLELCSPSLTIRKLAQSPGSTAYAPAPGWDMNVTPTVTGGFDWILPEPGPGAGAPSKTVATDAQGFAQFQWEPTVADARSNATVVETLEPDYTAGRPGANNDWMCELKDVDGNVRTVSGELAVTGATASFSLAPTAVPPLTPGIGAEVVTCTVYNSFDYDPDLELEKVDEPTVVRSDVFGPPSYPADTGDLVTSTFTVTNTGNAVLQLVSGGDSRCTGITYVSGDANDNDLLDPGPGGEGEAWVFECTRTGPWAGTSITNLANVTGVDPEGTVVTDEAQATVQVRTPGIDIVKTVSLTTVEAGVATPLTYTYVVTNPGNVALGAVSVTDEEPDQGSCTPLTGPAGDTDGDGQLDPVETWTYTCGTTVSITEPLVNTATASGTPVIPGRPPAYPNPPVTAKDDAIVTPVTPGLVLTKNAVPEVVYPGTAVTYEYTLTNDGDVPLRNPAAGSPRDGWIVDTRGPTGTCAPVTYVSGDANGNNLLDPGEDGDPGETWSFTCTATINRPARNTAVVIAATPGDQLLTRFASDFVDVVSVGIDLQKTAIRPVVLDPAAPAVGGPDVPLRTPAAYTYLVTNPGDVPLSNVEVTDTFGGQGRTCPVLPVLSAGVNAGDTNGDSLLDVGEAWQFQCVLTSVPLPSIALTKGDSDLGSAQSATEPAPVTNTAQATGAPVGTIPGLPQEVSSPEREQTVEVISPAILITKDVEPQVVLPGTEVTYTFLVSNPGDSPMRVAAVLDEHCVVTPEGGLTNAGDVDDDGLVDTDETWRYHCTDVIELPESGTVVTNTAAVLAMDPLGNSYMSDDPAEVRVIDPAINLVKTVSESLVPAGTEVSYEFLVTNAGRSPLAADDVLAQVALSDTAEPAQPSCATPTLDAKLGGNDDALLDREPAETWRYTCAATITEPTTNEAVVTALGGTQFELEVPVTDSDAAFVQAFRPAIDVEKTATPTQLFDSGQVTYTYAVRNTGDVPLSGVAARITDNTCAPVTYVSGDLDSDGLLDTPTSIFEDAADETWVFTCVTTVNQATVNTVVTPGTPTDPTGEPLCHPPTPAGAQRQLALPASCDVTDRDQAVVTVVKAATITVIKQASPTDTGQVFDFAFGSQAFGLAHAGARTFTGLQPGTYEVRELGTSDWALVGVTCVDPTGDTRTDLAAGRATVVVAAGEAVTCTFINEAEATDPDEETEVDEEEGSGSLPGTGGDLRAPLLTGLLGLLLLLAGLSMVRVQAARG